MDQVDATADAAKTVTRKLTTPRAAAVAGILFAVLLGASLYFIQVSISADEARDGSWLTTDRDRVAFGVLLIPFAGISFLWFMGVLRQRLGELEDQFYTTVFLGSGLLLLAMMFTGTAVTGAILVAHEEHPEFASTSAYGVAAPIAVVIFQTYSLKMGGVFLFSLGTMWLRTGIMPRWVALTQFAVGAGLLFGAVRFEWSVLVFPLWILLISVYLLVLAYRPPAEVAEVAAVARERRNDLASRRVDRAKRRAQR
jgi:hypothetical protein